MSTFAVAVIATSSSGIDETTSTPTASPSAGSGTFVTCAWRTPAIARIAPSTSAGYTVAPLTLNMSSRRPSYQRSWSASSAPRSPVGEKPPGSNVVSRVRPQIPRTTFGPRTQISPISPHGTVLPTRARRNDVVDELPRVGQSLWASASAESASDYEVWPHLRTIAAPVTLCKLCACGFDGRGEVPRCVGGGRVREIG